LKNVRAKPLRLMRMFAAFEKCSRQTFAPDENGAVKRKKKLEIRIKRKQ
jgi:hypothetical protein